jgi:hypothetical protein
MTTDLPPDAPRCYGRALLGARTLAWMKARGWIDARRVTRIARDGRGEEGK